MRLYLSSFRLGNKPEELVKLLKGKKRTGLIQNAIDFKSQKDRDESLERETNELKSLGLTPTEIDLRNYFGKKEELKKVIAELDALWIRGGNTFVLRRAFAYSGADKIIKELLLKDSIVYAGYSAALDILTPTLHGTELVDDPHIVPPGYKPEIIWDCLGLLPYSLAPHYKSDHPESAATDNSVQYLIDNHMPFIALRDGEALVINGKEQRIVK